MFEADGIESDEEVRGLPERVCCVRGGVPEAFPPVIFLVRDFHTFSVHKKIQTES